MRDERQAAGTCQCGTLPFDELVREHRNSLYMLCLHYTRDADAADDLVQDAILSAYLKLAELEDETRFGPWLSAIALNHCRRWSRHQRRHQQLNGEEQSLVDSALSPEDASLSRESRELVEAGIARLSPVHQQVVRMFYLEDRSLKQIAATLGLNAQAANQRLYRARLRLREELGIMTKQQDYPLALREFARSESAVDFAWPPADPMTLDALRGLEGVHDDLALALSTTLSSLAGRPVDVDTAFVDQVYHGCYCDYLQKRSGAGPVCSFALPPFEGRAVLEVRDPLMAALADPRAEEEDGVTVVLNGILHDLQTAMAAIQPVVVSNLVLEPDASAVRIAAADDLVEVVAIQVDRPEWWMTFCYPMAMLKPLSTKLESSPRPL